MPKPRTGELITCRHFRWRLLRRSNGVFYADGRSNQINAGRHSLDTRDRAEALHLVAELDTAIAIRTGLIEQSTEPPSAEIRPLSLGDGRKQFDEHNARPITLGGIKRSTQKKYRSTLDRFLAFAQSEGINDWQEIDEKLLTKYAIFLTKTMHRRGKCYAPKSIFSDITLLKSAIKWLIEAGLLVGKQPLRLPLQKVEGERPYCWRPQEVNAIVNHCLSHPNLLWIGDVVIGLACTGLRISELASLRWEDIDLNQKMLLLTDQSGHNRQLVERRDLKSKRSRMFPLHPEFLAVLQRMKHRGPFVYYGPRGGRLKPDTVRRIFVDEVVLPLAPRFPAEPEAKAFAEGRFHSFRHYFCSRCANSGVPERMVMAWLGHRESGMIRHYYHLHDQESRRQMERLDLLGNTGQQSAGLDNGTANNNAEDSPSQERAPAIAT